MPYPLVLASRRSGRRIGGIHPAGNLIRIYQVGLAFDAQRCGEGAFSGAVRSRYDSENRIGSGSGGRQLAHDFVVLVARCARNETDLEPLPIRLLQNVSAVFIFKDNRMTLLQSVLPGTIPRNLGCLNEFVFEDIQFIHRT